MERGSLVKLSSLTEMPTPTGELMKIDHTPQIEETVAQATRVKLIAPGLVLALLLSPFSYAVAQQSRLLHSQSASQSPT